MHLPRSRRSRCRCATNCVGAWCECPCHDGPDDRALWDDPPPWADGPENYPNP